MSRTSSVVVLVAAVRAFAGGCGRNDVKMFHTWGTVTFDGQPVPAGRIDFFPDLAQGNDGPQGYALIKEGKFDTRNDGQGHCGGHVVIKIDGFDGKSPDPKYFGTPIFIPHEIKRELPKQEGPQSFEVPKSAAEGLVVPATLPKS